MILIAKLDLMYVKAKNQGEKGTVTKSVRPLDKTVMLLNRKSRHRFGHGNLGHGLAVLIYIYIFIYLFIYMYIYIQ